MWKYSIELFKDGEWIKEYRTYKSQKQLSDFDLYDIPNKRRNAKLEIYMPEYYSETDKAREIIDPKYLLGKVLDIGCGTHKIKPAAIGIDGRQLDGVDIVLKDEDEIYELNDSNYDIAKNADTLFSSHCLEHLKDDYCALMCWHGLISQGGYLILYLPDGNLYSHDGNSEHMRPYTYESFMFWFRRVFAGEGKNYKGENFPALFKIIETSLDDRPDCYSFLLIAQKIL